jgi:hypothetical protein
LVDATLAHALEPLAVVAVVYIQVESMVGELNDGVEERPPKDGFQLLGLATRKSGCPATPDVGGCLVVIPEILDCCQRHKLPRDEDRVWEALAGWSLSVAQCWDRHALLEGRTMMGKGGKERDGWEREHTGFI